MRGKKYVPGMRSQKSEEDEDNHYFTQPYGFIDQDQNDSSVHTHSNIIANRPRNSVTNFSRKTIVGNTNIARSQKAQKETRKVQNEYLKSKKKITKLGATRTGFITQMARKTAPCMNQLRKEQIERAQQKEKRQKQKKRQQRKQKEQQIDTTEPRYRVGLLTLNTEQKLCIAKSTFKKLVNEVVNEIVDGQYRIHFDALELMQRASESYVECLFEDGRACMEHAQRKTIMRKDFNLARRLRGEKSIEDIMKIQGS